MNKEAYEDLVRKIKSKRKERESYIKKFAEPITKNLGEYNNGFVCLRYDNSKGKDYFVPGEVDSASLSVSYTPFATKHFLTVLALTGHDIRGPTENGFRDYDKIRPSAKLLIRF